MIRSMTAFARAESIADGLTVNMEIRAVNSRHLDLNVRLPSRYLGLEEKIRNTVVQHLNRGRIDIRVQIQDQEAESFAFEIDETRAAAYHAALDSLRQQFDIDTPISLDAILGTGGIIKPIEHEPDLAACQPAVDTCPGASFGRTGRHAGNRRQVPCP